MENPLEPQNENKPAKETTLVSNSNTAAGGSAALPPNGGGHKAVTKALSQQEVEKQELEQDLNNLISEVVVADEWGIFKNTNTQTGIPQPSAMDELLAQAREALAAGKLKEAEAAILRGRQALNHAQITNWGWAINNQFGLLPILITALFALLTYRVVFRMWFGLDGMNLVHHAAFAGMVGAVLRSLYWLQYQTSKGLLRPRWFVTFIVAPPLGAILGWLVSLLVRVSVQAVTAGKDSVNTDWRTISLLAAFAGFNWEWALGILEEAAKSTLARIREKTPSKTKP